MALIDDVLDITELQDSDAKDKARRFLEVQARINQDLVLKLEITERELKKLRADFDKYVAASAHWRDIPGETVTY